MGITDALNKNAHDQNEQTLILPKIRQGLGELSYQGIITTPGHMYEGMSLSSVIIMLTL